MITLVGKVWLVFVAVIGVAIIIETVVEWCDKCYGKVALNTVLLFTMAAVVYSNLWMWEILP